MIDFNAISMDAPNPSENIFRMDAAESVLQHTKASNPDATPDQINGILTTIICGELRKRKSADGVRNTFWRYQGMIGPMRSVSPDCHDQIFLEFAERITTVG